MLYLLIPDPDLEDGLEVELEQCFLGGSGFELYESHYIADQNILVTSAIVRKLQLSEFEVRRGGVYVVVFTEKAGIGFLCV